MSLKSVFISIIKRIRFKEYRLTIIGLAASLVGYVIIVAGDLELFEAFVDLLWRFERFEVDEILIPVGFFVSVAALDYLMRRRREKIRDEKEKIYTAMLASSNHVLNNFINQMQIFRIAAEEGKGFSESDLALYDEVVEEAVAKLQALGSVKKIDHSAIRSSVHPDTFKRANSRYSVN